MKNTRGRSKPDNYNKWESARLSWWRSSNNHQGRCLKVTWVSFHETCLYTPQRCRLSTIQLLHNPSLQYRDMNLWYLACLIFIQKTCLRQKKPKIVLSRQSRLLKISRLKGNQSTLDWSQIIFSHHRRSTTIRIKSIILTDAFTITLRCKICLWAKEGLDIWCKTETVNHLTFQVQLFNKNLKIMKFYHSRSHQIIQHVENHRISGNR